MAHPVPGTEVRFQLDVLFKGGPRLRPALTHVVGLKTVFIRTDELRPANQLVRFTVIDPSDGHALELMGIVQAVVPVVRATPGQPPGISLELFGNGRENEARWLHLVRRVQHWASRGYTSARYPGYDPRSGHVTQPDAPRTPAPPPASATQPAVQAPAAPPAQRDPTPPAVQAPQPPGAVRPARPAPQQTPEAHPGAGVLRRASPKPAGAWAAPGDTIRRRHVRRPAAQFNVTVRPHGMEALGEFGLKDISEGGTFVLAGTLLPVGTRVNVRLVHPSADADFILAGEVVRSIDSKSPDEKGMGIAFDKGTVDPHEWVAFLQQAAPLRQPEVGPVPDDAPPVRVMRRGPRRSDGDTDR